MIDALRAGYHTQQIGYSTQKTDIAKPSTQQTRTQDTVSLSGASKLVSSFFAGMGVDFTPGKNVSLNDIEKGLQQKQQTLDSEIKAMFIKNSIATPPEVKLTSNKDGHVQVSGNHPQSDQIEQLFADNPELENDFRKVSAMSSMVEAGHEYVDFANQYEKNPYAAIAQYGEQIFGQKDSNKFTMTVGASSSSSHQAGEPSIDFTNTTRKELFNWMNEEIRSGRMSLDESAPLMKMTLKISVATGQSVSMETDETSINFAEKARLGLKAAIANNDHATEQQLRGVLNIIKSYQSQADV